MSDLCNRLSSVELSFKQAISPPVKSELQLICDSLSEISVKLGSSSNPSTSAPSDLAAGSLSSMPVLPQSSVRSTIHLANSSSTDPKLQADPRSDTRKFNIVVFGISEQKEGLPCSVRWRNDFDRISSVISEIKSDSNYHSSIQDCHRLGKYNGAMSRPRPLLVSLNSTADVHSILSRHCSLSSSVSIKPDLSPSDRKVDSLLLQERHKLINSGVGRKSIRLRGSSSFVNGQLHGKVLESVLTLSPIPGAPAPHPSVCPDESSLQLSACPNELVPNPSVEPDESASQLSVCPDTSPDESTSN